MPFLLSAIQITPTVLFGPGGSMWKLPLRRPYFSIAGSHRNRGSFTTRCNFHSPTGVAVCAEPIVTGYAATNLSLSKTPSMFVLVSIFTAMIGGVGGGPELGVTG